MAQNKDPIMRNLLLPDKHYCYSMPAVSALLAAIAGTMRLLVSRRVKSLWS